MPKFLFLHRGVLLVTLAALSAVTVATAQSAPQPATASQSAQNQQPTQPSDDSQKPGETLKVNVNVVQLFFNVKDKHGALIPNLTKDDFDIA
jgi:glucose/arabinose dehydrogenase